MRLLFEIVGKLKISADTFMQYFFWSGLNEAFKSQLVQITNNCKPSLTQMFDHFFEASDRYLCQAKLKSKEKRF